MNIEAQAVVVLYPNYFGIGINLSAADGQAKRAGYRDPSAKARPKGKVRRVIYLFDCAPSEVSVDGMGSVCYPQNASFLITTEVW